MPEQTKQNIIKQNIDELKPGMKIARDVEYEFGSIFISKGSILDKHKISRLKKVSLENVYVYEETEEQIQENLDKMQKIESNYQESKDKMKSIYEKVRNNDNINYGEVKELTYEITSIGNDKEMMGLLTRVREVDEYTYNHLLNVGMFSYMFGKWLELSREECEKLTQAGLLHDIGKAYIPDEILNKPGKLTDEEYKVMKKHSFYGYKMCNNYNKISQKTAEAILTHHERYDGSGYPMGLRGKKIPLFGRILGIVDTFDAITADRVYQTKRSPFSAIKLFNERDIKAFDYSLVKVFLKKLPSYFVNKKVKLKDGRTAKIIFINPQHPDKPIIKVDGEYIDLYKNKDIYLQEMLEK